MLTNYHFLFLSFVTFVHIRLSIVSGYIPVLQGVMESCKSHAMQREKENDAIFQKICSKECIKFIMESWECDGIFYDTPGHTEIYPA
jgi:hypothetical protein